MVIMRASTFEKRYGPLPAPSGSDFWERDEIAGRHPHHVWTVVEYDGLTFVQAGYHFVNRIAYVVTRQPWATGEEEARW